MRGLAEYRAGRTTILVAHRLSTIKAADIIHGMEHGKVVESGTHDQLMEKTGVYFSLVTLQSTEKKKENEKEEKPSEPADVKDRIGNILVKIKFNAEAL